MIERGWKNQLVKSTYAYFSPIDLKLPKLQKRAKNVSPAERNPQYNKFHFGEKNNQERGGGQKMNFKFNMHPCATYKL